MQRLKTKTKDWGLKQSTLITSSTIGLLPTALYLKPCYKGGQTYITNKLTCPSEYWDVTYSVHSLSTSHAHTETFEIYTCIDTCRFLTLICLVHEFLFSQFENQSSHSVLLHPTLDPYLHVLIWLGALGVSFVTTMKPWVSLLPIPNPIIPPSTSPYYIRSILTCSDLAWCFTELRKA